MKRRRLTTWCALWAIFLYGVSPLLACLAAHPLVPLACQTGRMHLCPCHPGLHSAEECCCGREDSRHPKFRHLPCEEDPVHALTVVALAHPLLPPPGQGRVFAAPSSFRHAPEPVRAVLAGFLGTELPPPRLSLG